MHPLFHPPALLLGLVVLDSGSFGHSLSVLMLVVILMQLLPVENAASLIPAFE